MLAGGGGRAKNWCFTINNPIPGDSAGLGGLYTYMVVGNEVGADGTPHMQGYIMFKERKTFATVKKLIPRAHLEVAKGSPQQAADYCKKDGDFVEEGELPKVTQGKRNDLEEFALAIPNMTNRELYDAYPSRYLLYAKHVDKVRMVVQPKPKNLDKRCGIWLWGPPMSGKSTKARTYGDFYEKLCTKWWDGYENQPTVIIDDLDKSHEWMAYLLKIWADKFPFNAEVKGGTLHIRPERIIVTSNHMMENVFLNAADYNALKSRFEIIETFHDPNYNEVVMVDDSSSMDYAELSQHEQAQVDEILNMENDF